MLTESRCPDTFLLIHYLSYVTLEVEGTPVSEFVSFWQYTADSKP